MPNISAELSRILPLTAAISDGGVLQLGGIAVDELRRRYATPLYVYDEQTLRGQCRTFKQAFDTQASGEVKISYSAKAFANPTLFQIVDNEGLGLDVVSEGELEVAKKAHFPPSKISLHGNNKSVRELQAALKYGVGTVVIDGFQEIELLASVAVAQGIRQKVLLRVSPAVDPVTHRLTATGLLDSKFGFTLNNDKAYKALNTIAHNPALELEGIHFHLGSPLFTTTPYRDAIEYVVAFIARFVKESGVPIKVLNTGGGFAVASSVRDEPPSIEDYAAVICQSLARATEKHGLKQLQLAVETGRALVSRCGVALYTVGEIKEVEGVRNFVAVDGGMGDNIRPTLYQAEYKPLIANRMLDTSSNYLCTIAGRYCESGDLLVKDARMPRPEPDDIVALASTGAYCLAMSSNYNMVPRPAVVMVAAGKAREICRRETYCQILERHC